METKATKAHLLSLLLLLLVTLFFHAGATAAKMYKWTDKNGEVHFSQTLPIGDESSIAYDQVKIQQTTGAVLVPSTIDGQLYCGELQLPKQSKYQPQSVKNLTTKTKSWRKSLKRSQQALDRFLIPKKNYRYSSSYRKSTTFNEELARHQKPVHEYLCAVEWARGKIAGVRESEMGYMEAKSKAQKDLNVATAQMHRICGDEPEKYNEYGKKRQRYLEWKKCTRKYGAVVREMRDKLRTVERKTY